VRNNKIKQGMSKLKNKMVTKRLKIIKNRKLRKIKMMKTTTEKTSSNTRMMKTSLNLKSRNRKKKK
jgi:hypothetical protein